MQNTIILDSLNAAQRAAVSAPPEHLLVLAGAGSGKTRVLVHRIAWLVENAGVAADRILSVTFTNKAAAEMRGRLETMLHMPMQRLWVGTFHGMAHRLLRLHWLEAGLQQTFQVIDGDEQFRLIRRILKNLNLDDTRWPPKQAQWFINGQKEECIRPQQIKSEGDMFTETYKRVYQLYEELCKTSGLVDFSELLLRSYELWETQPQLLAHYQQRFAHILVDEFQDTNHIQYQWLKKLAGTTSKLMIVGDDDQSIYSWRGAKVEHLSYFIRDFPDVMTVRLEQNYRSTATILNAANAVIAHNQNRLGKNLWTEGKKGDPIIIYAAFNDRDEASFVIRQIKEWVAAGGARRESAILYRSNAQSRVLEEELLNANIAYRVYGGLRFFERAEIKDALAYLRLIANRNDDSAFERVVNLPTRGIGDTTLILVRDLASQATLSLWQAAEQLLIEQKLPTRSATALQKFLVLINQISHNTHAMSLREQTESMLEMSGLLAFYQLDRSEKGLARVENLEELISATQEFIPQFNEEDATPLTEFLSHITLETGELEAAEFSDCVQLMTLHAAKGLEFPLVFLTGMEEGLFPHAMSSQNPLQLEEERRLCYVGMTRAMSKLYLSYAESRHLHGREMWQRPSRFLQEIPQEFLRELSLKTKITRPVYRAAKTTANETLKYPLGCRVTHSSFGEGMVVGVEGSGDHARVQVRFTSGTKWLVASYAKLAII